MITEIRAPLIVAFDGQEHRLLENGIVVVRDDKIVHVGKTYSGGARAQKPFRLYRAISFDWSQG